MKSVVEQLLDLPLEIKQRNVDVIPGTGYLAPSEKNPLYESLGLFDVASSASVSNFCSQLRVSSQQREIIESYAEAMYEFSIDMARKMAKSMGVEDYNFEGWSCTLRMNKYNFTPESIGSSGVQNHTDSGFLTILQDDENIGGLQVMNETGKYVAADYLPGTLVVNFGDAATLWSNGILRNVQHRVQCKGAGIRMSIATFLSPPHDQVIESLPNFVDADQPPIYGPITFEALRGLRVSKNLRAGEALQLIRLHNTKSI
uniref:Fe2OG dioxygenase domain-containing protein n=2 Tax=Chenopodium quinoa TaxID=63459 RepID=A0A803KWB7_CHEQI